MQPAESGVQQYLGGDEKCAHYLHTLAMMILKWATQVYSQSWLQMTTTRALIACK